VASWSWSEFSLCRVQIHRRRQPAFAAVGDRCKGEPPRGHERALNWP
jgi:hypothetical protein